MQVWFGLVEIFGKFKLGVAPFCLGLGRELDLDHREQVRGELVS